MHLQIVYKNSVFYRVKCIVSLFKLGLLLTTGEGYLHVLKSKLALNPRPDRDNNQCLAKSETPNDVSVWMGVKCKKW